MLRLHKAVTLLTRGSRPLLRTPQFSFSKGLKQAEKQLIQSLNTEINYEEEDQNQENIEFEEKFLANHNWELLVSEDSTRLELKKQVDRTTVRVVYAAKLPEENPEVEGENQEEAEQNEPNFTEFQVIVDNHNNANKLIVDVASYNGEININGAFITSEVDTFLANRSAMFTTEKYTGPMFESLDEKLQDTMANYLKNLGIDEDLAVFVESSAANHEDKLYKKWLKELKEFLH